jgi:dihydropteroate synthase
VEAGATIVNDVSALRFDPELAGLVADRGATCVLMHMLGEPRTMQDDPRYDDVVAEVKSFLEERLAFAVAAGIPEDKVWLDPGIGFGKTAEHNLELLRRLDEIAAVGRPVVVGTSRKSFLGKITGKSEEGRLAGTVATNVMALERGAQVFRVHDVAEVGDALRVASALLR